jgi:hypothetical protein
MLISGRVRKEEFRLLGSGLPGFRYPKMPHDADADIARMWTGEPALGLQFHVLESI